MHGLQAVFPSQPHSSPRSLSPLLIVMYANGSGIIAGGDGDEEGQSLLSAATTVLPAAASSRHASMSTGAASARSTASSHTHGVLQLSSTTSSAVLSTTTATGAPATAVMPAQDTHHPHDKGQGQQHQEQQQQQEQRQEQQQQQERQQHRPARSALAAMQHHVYSLTAIIWNSGTTCSFVSAAVFALNSLMVKLLHNRVPSTEIILYRRCAYEPASALSRS